MPTSRVNFLCRKATTSTHNKHDNHQSRCGARNQRASERRTSGKNYPPLVLQSNLRWLLGKRERCRFLPRCVGCPQQYPGALSLYVSVITALHNITRALARALRMLCVHEWTSCVRCCGWLELCVRACVRLCSVVPTGRARCVCCTCSTFAGTASDQPSLSFPSPVCAVPSVPSVPSVPCLRCCSCVRRHRRCRRRRHVTDVVVVVVLASAGRSSSSSVLPDQLVLVPSSSPHP